MAFWIFRHFAASAQIECWARGGMPSSIVCYSPKVFAILRPSAIIPIHTDHPAAFERLFGSEWPVVCLHDGETFEPEKLLIRT